YLRLRATEQRVDQRERADLGGRRIADDHRLPQVLVEPAALFSGFAVAPDVTQAPPKRERLARHHEEVDSCEALRARAPLEMIDQHSAIALEPVLLAPDQQVSDVQLVGSQVHPVKIPDPATADGQREASPSAPCADRGADYFS